MKTTTFITLMTLMTAFAVKASPADQGTIKNISCLNSEMTNEEIQAASTSFLGMKIGDAVSINDIRNLTVDENGITKDGMGLIENKTKLVLLVKAEGFCQKSKVEKSDDGLEKSVEVIGTMVISIEK